MTKREIKIDDVIAEVSSIPEHKFGRNCTNSSLFLLYAISYKIITMPSNFVNAFLDDKEFNNNYDRPLFLLFKTDMAKGHRDHSWTYFEKSMVTHPCFVHSYYAGKEDKFDLVMYVFEVPKLFADDYDKFKLGKYSEFSVAYKEQIPAAIIQDKVVTPFLYRRVVEKDPTLKAQIEEMVCASLPENAELWSKPDLYGRETYRSHRS